VVADAIIRARSGIRVRVVDGEIETRRAEPAQPAV
jgi:hypothetical protein